MTCPFLDYREASADREFDVARAYCTAADRFVQPMRADVCNDRYELDHASHCEIYREHADGTDGERDDDRESGHGRDSNDRAGDGGVTSP